MTIGFTPPPHYRAAGLLAPVRGATSLFLMPSLGAGARGPLRDARVEPAVSAGFRRSLRRAVEVS